MMGRPRRRRVARTPRCRRMPGRLGWVTARGRPGGRPESGHGRGGDQRRYRREGRLRRMRCMDQCVTAASKGGLNLPCTYHGRDRDVMHPAGRRFRQTYTGAKHPASQGDAWLRHGGTTRGAERRRQGNDRRHRRPDDRKVLRTGIRRPLAAGIGLHPPVIELRPRHLQRVGSVETETCQQQMAKDDGVARVDRHRRNLQTVEQGTR